MKTIEEKRLEFLEDTVRYYSENISRRSFVILDESGSHERCLYRGPNGKTCAIGRWIPDEKYLPKMEGMPVTNILVYKNVDESIASLDDIDRNFLAKIQVLHDSSKYWASSSLSAEGENFINKIKEEYCKSS